MSLSALGGSDSLSRWQQTGSTGNATQPAASALPAGKPHGHPHGPPPGPPPGTTPALTSDLQSYLINLQATDSTTPTSPVSASTSSVSTSSGTLATSTTGTSPAGTDLQAQLSAAVGNALSSYGSQNAASANSALDAPSVSTLAIAA